MKLRLSALALGTTSGELCGSGTDRRAFYLSEGFNRTADSSQLQRIGPVYCSTVAAAGVICVPQPARNGLGNLHWQPLNLR